MKQPLLLVVIVLAVAFAVYMFFFSSIAPFSVNSEAIQAPIYE